jgi:hypothetical protein
MRRTALGDAVRNNPNASFHEGDGNRGGALLAFSGYYNVSFPIEESGRSDMDGVAVSRIKAGAADACLYHTEVKIFVTVSIRNLY